MKSQDRFSAKYTHLTRLTFLLGWLDVQQTYKRSKIGAFWVSIGSAVGILTVSIVYGLIFKIDLQEFLPYISISMIAWSFMAGSISEACNAFVMAEGIIKQLSIPLLVHSLRVIWRNLVIMAHNLVIYPITLYSVGGSLSWLSLLSILGLILVCINLAWIGLILAFASARFRDLGPVVLNVLQIAFYITPVIWMAKAMPSGIAHWILGLNPLYHMLQVVRLPLLGSLPTAENWVACLVLGLFGAVLSTFVYRKYRRKASLWV